MPIFDDAQTHPEKYAPEDRGFLEQLAARGPALRGRLSCGCSSEHWDLSEEELRRLDRLTLTFATAKRIEPPPAPPRRRMEKRPPPERRIVDLPSFWWLRKE